MSDEKLLTCARCGGPTAVGSAMITIGLCAHPCRTRDAKVEHHPDAVFCSKSCAVTATARVRTHRSQCIVCRSTIDQSHLYSPQGARIAGRPRVYCSDKCRDWVRREKRTAEKELARDKFATGLDELQEQQRRARMLADSWAGVSAEPSTAPSPLAVQRLRERLDTLAKRIELANAERWKEMQAERHGQQTDVWRERRARQAKLEAEWRGELLRDGSQDAS